MKNETFKYYAFISYSHKDKKIARKLQKMLEHYHLPSATVKSNPKLPKNLRPVFIDDLDLTARGNLKNALQENLEISNYLIVICSPSSAKSDYVNDEVEYFIQNGRAEHIIPFIVDGEPHAKDNALECFPPAILALPRENELLGINLKKHGTHEAFIRLVASMLRLDLDEFISRDAKERRRKTIIFTSIFIALIIIAIMLVPPPYDEKYAENVMESALSAYVRAGQQYENLHDLTETAINNPSDFDNQFYLYKNKTSSAAMTNENSLKYLDNMMKTGKVMPWSRKPMNQEECTQLLTLADNREKDYKYFASVLEFVMKDEFANNYYGTEYPKLLNYLLEIDADITSKLYQIVCSPHVTGQYADNSITAKGYANLFASVPKQNSHLTSEDIKQSSESLSRLKGARDKSFMDLNSCGAFEAYKSKFVITSGEINLDNNAKTSPEPESKDKSVVRVLNDLLGYVYNCEIIYSDILWALDYCEKFDREKSWKNLELARAAVSIAKSNIAGLRFPELEMTQEDLKILMNRGIDVNFLANADLIFKVEQTSLKNTCVTITNNMMYDIFLENDWEIAKRHFANTKKIMDYEIQYLANTADWVSISLNNNEMREKFNKLLVQYCPKTSEHQIENPENLNDIENSTNTVLNQIKNLVMEEEKIAGARANRVNILRYAISKDNFDSLSKNLMMISNMPPLILMPEWFDNKVIDIFYFWTENGKILKTPRPGTKLEKAPDGCRITINDIDLTKVKAYHQELIKNGVLCTVVSEEDKKFTAIYKIENSEFAIIWENGKVTVFLRKNPVCLVPGLYLSMMRQK